MVVLRPFIRQQGESRRDESTFEFILDGITSEWDPSDTFEGWIAGESEWTVE